MSERERLANRDAAPSRPLDRRRGVAGWVDPRGRRLGGWAFILNRVTGIGIVVYLYLHLAVLSLLARGPEAWDAFIAVALSPLFLFFDVVLLAGLLIHGLNGIRVTLTGFGLVLDAQKALFVALMVLAAIVLLVGAIRLVEVA
jgi:succinate dehydrogenase / fumarate reductase cytochrome b subunit